MKLSGWGGYPKIESEIWTLDSGNGLQEKLCSLSREGQWISYGLGRSYGDSALNRKVLFTGRFNKILGFDEEKGVLNCESGLSLAEISQAFLSRGWFLSVTPGTKFVTVGGAIASDVHGKNHHNQGCFSSCVLNIDLLLPNGEVISCSREENQEFFRATCGGMGLTGAILTATIQLKKVESAYIDQEIVKTRNLEQVFEQFEQNRHWTYSVAWIDCLAKGDNLGRSLLILGEHSKNKKMRHETKKTSNIPIHLPEFILNSWSVSCFNSLYYHKVLKNRINSSVSLESFFYPLDGIKNWNRLYGRKGFTQYQCVLPKQSSYTGLKKIIQNIADSGLGSFLAVLKLLGPENSNYLSFPMEGYTLALDFKIENRLFPLLNRLDQIVNEHGGRLYLSKDARMSSEMMGNGYKDLHKFLSVRNKYNLNETIQSLQSKRLGI